MASPEALQLEQKQRALKLKDDALSRQAEQQLRTEKRIKEHQKNVAEKERANQIKSQDLITRELKYKEEISALNKERQHLLDAQETLESSRQKPWLFIVPFLLLACSLAGYFAYEQLNKKAQHFEQVAVASKNIDKLAKLLSSTQDKVLTASNELLDKKDELSKTKSMLLGLKNTTDQLQFEITQLKGSQETSAEEKSALTLSANSLSEQLAILKTQLEDKYLTIDINEAFIDYQENDLNVFKAALTSQQETIQQKEDALSDQIQQQQDLENALKSKEQHLQAQSTQVSTLNNDLRALKNKLTLLQSVNSNLKQQNAVLTSAQKTTE